MAFKEFSDDHPKAKLMARKRMAILAAAKDSFLRLGYGSTSMEAIAASADVSIATLYRHAESKDDLFAAVIANACGPNDEGEKAEYERLMGKPLFDVLVAFGVRFQQRLAQQDTVALMRAVMAEISRFPELGGIAYRGFIGRFERMTDLLLGAKDEASGVSKSDRNKLSALFVDRLFGADMFRVLLGLDGTSRADQKARAERAASEVMSRIRQG